MKYLLLILLATQAWGQDNFVTDQKYPFNFQGRHYEPALKYDQWEVLSCMHDIRLWQGKDVNRSPCNWASKIQFQLSKWMEKPWKTNQTYLAFLKAFVDSIPVADTDGQTPFETLVKKSGNIDDHSTLLQSMIYFAQNEPQAKPILLPGQEVHSCYGSNEEWSERYGKCVCIKGYTRMGNTCMKIHEPRDHR